MRRSSSASGPRKNASRLWLAIALLLALSAGLAVVKLVVLKMLPFDNKSEIQVVVDMPEGSTLEQTNALLGELAAQVDKVPEVLNYQGYAGTSAPVNFNGLVRQYFLRRVRWSATCRSTWSTSTTASARATTSRGPCGPRCRTPPSATRPR